VTAERGEAEVLASELKGTLTEVEDALLRLEDGTYGRCIKCQKEIGSERLAALPMTPLCITCSSLDWLVVKIRSQVQRRLQRADTSSQPLLEP